MSESSKAWKLANPEKVKEQKAKWHQKNKERRNKLLSARGMTDTKRASNAAWNILNKDHKKAYNAEYEKAHPESAIVRKMNRRARKKSSGGNVSAGLKEKLIALQKGRCACCGEKLGVNFHMDHIMPLALGGMNTDDNIQLLRQTCNSQKSAKHPIDFMQQRGFLL